jgi:chemotaxis protein CheZ
MEHQNLEALFDETRLAQQEGPFDLHVEGAQEGSALLEPAVACQHSRRDPLSQLLEEDDWEAELGAPCSECGVPTGSVQSLRDRIGRMTRQLHESLQELRLDATLADVANEIPDARNRLKYVTEMCERSAKKVLDALDTLSPLQEASRDASEKLRERWERLLLEREPPDQGFMDLFEETRHLLAKNVERADLASGLYTEIMMAQDFQDLTGQVCRKIERITERIEAQLLKLLLDTAPDVARPRRSEELEGPQISAGQGNAVNSQTEVDDLLSSLGF